MEWSEEMKQTAMSKLKEYDIYFSADEVPPDIKFPEQWRNFGPARTGKSPVPAEWRIIGIVCRGSPGGSIAVC